MPYSIMLDAGHGGRDPGAVYNGRQEKIDTLSLTLAIGQILQERGIDVLYTRTTDIYESPYQKAMEANEAGVDFFISIHRNSFPQDNAVSGVESLVYDKSGIKLEMAENINEQLEGIGFVNLGVKARPGLVVLRRTKMPAVLVEVGFINSDTDNMLFDDNFSDIALAIAEGILDTLGINTPVVPLPDENELRSLRCLMKTHILMMPFLMKTTFLSFLFRLATQFKQAHFVIPCMPNDSAGSCPNLTFLPLSSRETDYTESW